MLIAAKITAKKVLLNGSLWAILYNFFCKTYAPSGIASVASDGNTLKAM
jgi:hypothetical protein